MNNKYCGWCREKIPWKVNFYGNLQRNNEAAGVTKAYTNYYCSQNCLSQDVWGGVIVTASFVHPIARALESKNIKKCGFRINEEE